MKWTVVREMFCGLLFLSIAIGNPIFADTLEGTFTFTKQNPKVALIYFPEDKSLSTDIETVVDQKDQQFTKQILVTTKGVQASFKNSDTVNHNIFTNDKDLGIHFDVGLMPPGGSLNKEITWEDQIVRCSCKIHPKMKMWIASISSKYYTTIEFKKGEKTFSFTMDSLPDHLSKIKVWMPKYEPIEVNLGTGESTEAKITRKNKPFGTLTLVRK